MQNYNSTQKQGRVECHAGSVIGTKDFESRLCQEAVLYLVASRFIGNGTISYMLKNKNRIVVGFGAKNKMRQISTEQKTDKMVRAGELKKKKSQLKNSEDWSEYLESNLYHNSTIK